MAEGFFNFYNKNPEYTGVSAGTYPVKSIKQYAIEAMKEKGANIAKQKPKIITPDRAQKAFLIFTMGCIRDCPVTTRKDQRLELRWP